MDVSENIAGCWDHSLSFCQVSMQSRKLLTLIMFGGSKPDLGTQGSTTFFVLGMHIINPHPWVEGYCNLLCQSVC